jgi:hypothetical protein
MHAAVHAVGSGWDLPEQTSPESMFSIDYGVTWSDLPARSFRYPETHYTVNVILCFWQRAVVSAFVEI